MHRGKRIQWIDVAKGICMISVIAGHMGVEAVNRVVFAYHLTVFFILSGYTLKNNLSRDNLNNRFKSLMVPYFMTCFAVTIMDVINLIVIEHVTDNIMLTKKVADDLLRSFMASGTVTEFTGIDVCGRIGAIWFLPATFFAVVFTQILLKYLSSRTIRYCISILIALLAHISAGFIWFPFSLQAGMFAAPLVLLGYDLREFDALEKLNWRKTLVYLCVFIVGILSDKTRIYYVTASMPDIIISPICALAASGCVFYISQKLERCKSLAWIGRNSIYFLCIHLFEMETMGRWFRKLIAAVGIKYNAGVMFVVKFIFIAGVTAVILFLKTRQKHQISLQVSETINRDLALDIAKAVLIVLMLVGHFTVDINFRKIVYSFHMVAFVFYSGYCFKPEACLNMKRALKNLVKSFLVPYGIFSVIYVLTKHMGIKIELQNLICGISFAKKLFIGYQSIGPMYFVLLLFLVRVIYLFVERFVPRELEKSMIILIFSAMGQFLGEHGYWLPWSLDCALYALIFYHLGYYFRKYGVMEFLCNHFYYYFALSCIWVYMIYKGSMEIAIRHYGTYGVVILGAISASVLLYVLCRYLYNTLEKNYIKLFSQIGRNTVYILIVHAALGGNIGNFVANYLAQGHVYYTVAMVAIQILLGIAIGNLNDIINKKYCCVKI